MDEYSGAIAANMAKTKSISNAEIAETTVLLSAKTGMENVSFDQVFTLKAFAPDGSHITELLYASAQGTNDCGVVPFDMAYENVADIPFLLDQKLISVTLCVSLNAPYFLTPVLRLLGLTFTATGVSPFSFLGRRTDDETC